MKKERTMNVDEFFKRIGMPENIEIANTYDFLKELHYRFILSVPYENLDIISSVSLSLKPEDIYDKIVKCNRGGYCFETNCLFNSFLKLLGFETINYLGRFLRGETKIPVRRHRITAVKCEGDVYICDVGVGQSAPRYPLQLKNGIVQEQFGEKYKFIKDNCQGWILYDFHKGEWQKFYSFTEDEQIEIDYVLPSFYCEKHPDSPFNKTAMVAIKTASGRKSINDREYKVFEGEKLVYIESQLSDKRRKQILKDEFGIEWTGI